MKKRYLHTLYQFAKGNYPRWMVALEVEERDDEWGRCVMWAACWWRLEHGMSRAHSMALGTDQQSWWDLLSTLLSAGGQTMIVINQAYNSLTTLGMWKHLEDGSLSTAPLADSDTGEKVVDNGLLISDFMVLHNPPFIASISVPGRKGRALAVDVRNYGVDIGQHSGSLPFKAARLAAIVSQMGDILCKAKGPPLGATSAATAWTWWRMRFLPPGVMVHAQEDALRLERSAIHGGRCEAFQLGECPEPAYQVDIRAAYPAVAATTQLPVRLIDNAVGTQPKVYGSNRRSVGYIIDADVEVDSPIAPHLSEGFVIYPVGKFRTTICGPEQEMVKLYGHLTKVHSWASYEMEDVLSAFIKHVWMVRQVALQGQERHIEQFIKSLSVAIIGKFAQRARHWEYCPGRTPPFDYGTYYDTRDDNTVERMRAIAWRAERMVDIGEHAESIPAIAAWIYSEQRLRLWRMIEAAGRDNVYYCDTDSIFTNDQGYSNLCGVYKVGLGDLGDVRLVGCAGPLRVFGVKHYTHCGRTIRAGVPAQGAYTPPTKSTVTQLPPAVAYKHGLVCPDGRVEPWRIG